jgi:hypothetical protein
MLNERVYSKDSAGAGVILRPGLELEVPVPHFSFNFSCYRPKRQHLAQCMDLDGRAEELELDGNLTHAKAMRDLSFSMKELIWEDTAHNRVTTQGKNDLIDKYFRGSVYSAAFYCALIGANANTAAITTGTAGVTASGSSFVAGDAAGDIIIVGAGAAAADLIQTIASYTSGTQVTLSGNAGTTVAAAAFAMGARVADTASSKGFTENATYSNGTRPALTLAAAASGSTNNSASPAVFNINGTTRVFGAAVYTDSTKSGSGGVLYSGAMFAAPGSRSMASSDTLNVTATLSC